MPVRKRNIAKPPTGAPPRLHDVQIDLRMTRTYYNVLNDNCGFRQDLDSLFHAFDRLGFYEGLAVLFARHWSLPSRYGVKDLSWSYRWRRPGRPARLQVGSRFFPPSPTKRMPPQLADPQRRARPAHRLYRFVVLGHGYHRVAAADGVDVRAAFDSIRLWSRRTGVPLPHRPPGQSPPSTDKAAKTQ